MTSDPDYDESDGSSAASPSFSATSPKRPSLSPTAGVSRLPPLAGASGLPLPPTSAAAAAQIASMHQRHPSTDGTLPPPMHDAPARPSSKSVGGGIGIMKRRSTDASRGGGLPLPGEFAFCFAKFFAKLNSATIVFAKIGELG